MMEGMHWTRCRLCNNNAFPTSSSVHHEHYHQPECIVSLTQGRHITVRRDAQTGSESQVPSADGLLAYTLSFSQSSGVPFKAAFLQTSR